MGTTRINVEEAIESVTNARRHLEEQRSSLDSISSTLNTMQGIWDAADQRACADRFATSKKNFDSFNDRVSDIFNEIESYANDCLSTDSQAARLLSNVSW